MKEEINLLPPAIKDDRLQRIYWSRIGNVIKRIIVIMVVFTGALGAMLGILYREQTILETTLAHETQSDQNIEKDVKDINRLLETINTHVQTQVSFSNRLPEIMRVMPESISMITLRVTSEPPTLVIEGIAASRTMLLDFQKKLEQLSWVDHVEAPLQNLATGSQGAFQVSIFPKPVTP